MTPWSSVLLCGQGRQKAANLAREDRVSPAIDYDTPDLTTSGEDRVDGKELPRIAFGVGRVAAPGRHGNSADRAIQPLPVVLLG